MLDCVLISHCIVSGSIFLPDGWSTSWRHQWASCIITLHKGHIYRPWRWPGDWDAVYHSWETGKLHNKWWPHRLFQFNYSETWWFLRWGTSWMGSCPQAYYQLAFIHSDCEGPHRSWGLFPPGWGSQVCCQSVQAVAQQEVAAHFPVLLAPLANLGLVLHPSCLAAVQEEEDGKGLEYEGVIQFR